MLELVPQVTPIVKSISVLCHWLYELMFMYHTLYTTTLVRGHITSRGRQIINQDINRSIMSYCRVISLTKLFKKKVQDGCSAIGRNLQNWTISDVSDKFQWIFRFNNFIYTSLVHIALPAPGVSSFIKKSVIAPAELNDFMPWIKILITYTRSNWLMR